MGWTLIEEAGKKIWQASEYIDLQYDEITNLAEHGQPRNPYQDGFDQDFMPDYQNVIVRMPHQAVMCDGHGKNIRPTDFPIVNEFLNGEIDIQDGSYSFARLKKLGKTLRFRRTIHGNLYAMSSIPTIPGAISAGDAAYIYGSVGYALMGSTRYEKKGNFYAVKGEIGVLHDNWDFQSGNPIAKIVNPLVATIFGPDYYNLEPNPSKPSDVMGRIEIEYFGPGKPFLVQSFVPSR